MKKFRIGFFGEAKKIINLVGLIRTLCPRAKDMEV